jgi:hypothetical protein
LPQAEFSAERSHCLRCRHKFIRFGEQFRIGHAAPLKSGKCQFVRSTSATIGNLGAYNDIKGGVCLMKFRCVTNFIGNEGGSFSPIASANQIGRDINAYDRSPRKNPNTPAPCA